MSRVGMKHLTGYQGLAFARGPVTSSTSPLWSPYGPYSMNRNQFRGQFGGFYGEADGATEDAASSNGANGEEKGMIAKMMDNKTELLGYSIPTALLIGIGAYFLFFREGAPLKRLNPWTGDSDGHRDAAKIRWQRSKGISAKPFEERLARRAGLSLGAWKERSSLKGGKAGRYGRYAEYYRERAKKAATAAKATKYEIKKVGKSNQYFVDGVRVKTSKFSKTMKTVFGNMKQAGQKSLTANPRRRKNAIKTNPKRRRNALKTNRRRNGLSMQRNSAAQKRAQSNAKKAMKLYHSGKAKTLKSAWRMVR